MWGTKSSCDADEKHSAYGLTSGAQRTRAAGTSGIDRTISLRDGIEKLRNSLMRKFPNKKSFKNLISLLIKYGQRQCYYSQLLARRFMQKPKEMENRKNFRS